jgi:RHS repeat-associated protein
MHGRMIQSLLVFWWITAAAFAVAQECEPSSTFAIDLNEPVPLPPGTPVIGELDPFGSAVFVMTETVCQSVLLTVDLGAAGNEVEIYARRGQPPTRFVYDLYRPATAAQLRQELLISPGSAGPWFVLLYAKRLPAGPISFTVHYECIDLHLSEIAPRAGANSGFTASSVRGAGFTGEVEVLLTGGPGPEIRASEVVIGDQTKLDARFNLAGASEGLYDLQVRRTSDGETALLPAAFTVFRGLLGPQLVARLDVPPAFRPDRTYTMWLEYGNEGDADMVCPLFVISSPDGAPMAIPSGLSAAVDRVVTEAQGSLLPPVGGYSTNPIQILGISHDDPVGILRPGDRVRVPIYFHTRGVGGTIRFNLEQMVADQTPVDWSGIEANVRPAYIDSQAWDAIWSNFRTQMGDTWWEYLNALSAAATHLARYAHRTYEVDRLFALQFTKALNGFTPSRTLAAAIDAYAPARGLPLVFVRQAPVSLERRFALGPLGRGWTHNFDLRLARPDAETAVVVGGGASGRSFRRSGSAWRSSPGDYGQLAELAGGAFQIGEKDGVLTQFDAGGRLEFIQEPNGNRVSLVYAGDLLTTVAHSNGQSLTLQYNAQGRIERLTDHAGQVTEYFYGASGESLVRVAAYGGRETLYAYNPPTAGKAAHALVEISHPDGTHRYLDYDTSGRLTGQSRDGDAERFAYAYDSVASVAISDSLGAITRLQMGPAGQPLQVEDPLGNKTRLQYDPNGNLWKVTQPSGAVSRSSHDVHGNPGELVDALGRRTRLRHTAGLNRLDWLLDARNNKMDFSYDGAGNLTAIAYADGTLERYAYDAPGNLAAHINRRGQRIDYTYDIHGRFIRKDYSDGKFVTYAYDDAGRMTEAADTSGTIAMQYNGRGFLSRIEYPSGHWFTFDYNDAGRRTRRVGDDGYILNYQYDAVGRLERLTDGDDIEIIRYSYDSNGRLAREDKGNGTYTLYSYDPAGQVLSIVHHAPDDSIHSRFDYAYDANGNRVSMATLEGTERYEYDALGQLITWIRPDATRESYAYDALGNRTHVIDDGVRTDYLTNNMNQYTQVGDVVYAYDADGNMTLRDDAAETISYQYDFENRLTLVDSTTSGTWQYVYDLLGNRAGADHNGQATNYLHDPIGLVNMVGEYNGSGDLMARYVHGLGLVSRVEEMGSHQFYGFDAIGSTRQMTGPTGSVEMTLAYAPFGATQQPVTPNYGPFGFVGRLGVTTEPHGANDMRRRSYEPDIGRFSTTDPIGLLGRDTNLYRYVANNPIVFSDPSGTTLEWGDWNGWSDFVSETDTSLEDISSSLSPQTQLVLVGIGPAAFFVVEFGAVLIPPTVWLLTTRIGPFVLWILNNPQDAWDIVSGIWGLTENWEPGWVASPGFVITYGVMELLDIATSSLVVPRDPNEKTSPLGSGEPDFFIPPASPIEYIVYFENQPTATAAAQEVIITDQLHPDLDWATFELQAYAFGDTVLAVPPGLDHHGLSERIPMWTKSGDAWTASGEALLEIEASLNPQDGRVEWRFKTLDPETEDFPADPYAGFLPPNDATHRGEGYVSFTVRPRADVAPETVITNSASIVFDTNAPIVTNEVFNTISGDPPSEPGGPDPAHGSAEIALTATLRANANNDASSYDLYFWTSGGTKPATPTIPNHSLPMFTPPGGLQPNTAYHWQVVAKNRFGETPGPEWTFSTMTRSGVDSRNWVLYSKAMVPLEP